MASKAESTACQCDDEVEGHGRWEWNLDDTATCTVCHGIRDAPPVTPDSDKSIIEGKVESVCTDGMFEDDACFAAFEGASFTCGVMLMADIAKACYERGTFSVTAIREEAFKHALPPRTIAEKAARDKHNKEALDRLAADMEGKKSQ